MIEFSVPTPTHAKVEVYNLLASAVHVLIDRYLPAGHYSVTGRVMINWVARQHPESTSTD